MYCVQLQLFAGNDADEFSSILKRERAPKILITTCRFHSSVCTVLHSHFFANLCRLSLVYGFFVLGLQRGPDLIKELLSVIPNAHYYKRGTYDLKKVLSS